MSSRLLAAFFLLILLFLPAGCRAGVSDTTVIDVAGYPLKVEIADTDGERAQGLMNRRSLPDDRGMLFVFQSEGPVSFWMKNTSIPLSIAFIAADGTIRQIEDMEPYSLASISSRRNVLYALEVNQGWFDARGIREGDRIEIPEYAGARPR